MKKKLIIIFLIVILFIGGYFGVKEYQKKQLVNKAQEKAEGYVIENFEDVESVQIVTDNYDFSPMGTLGVGGRINNDDGLYFYATFLIENNEVGKLKTVVKAHDFPDRKDGK